MIPRRPLFALSAVIIALHALLLGWAAARSAPPVVAAAPVVFSTRTLAPPAAAPAPPPAAAVATPAPPAPPARAAARKRATRPHSAAVAAQTPAYTPADTPAPPTPPSDPQVMASADTPPAEPTEPPAPTALALSAAASDTPPPPAAPQEPASAPAALGLAVLAPGQEESSASAHPPPVRLPAPARLEFAVQGRSKGFGYSASAELLWQHDGQQYQARQEISALFLGARAQTSVGEITPLGLQPRRFGDRSRSEKAAHLDFAKGQATFSANTPPAPIAPGAQDRLSVFLQLGALLAAAPQSYPVGTRIQMTTVSARAADVWTFTVEGEQTLDLPLGSTRALLLERLPRREYDLKAQIWLAPALGYLPARIRITQANGDMVELNLQSHEKP